MAVPKKRQQGTGRPRRTGSGGSAGGSEVPWDGTDYGTSGSDTCGGGSSSDSGGSCGGGE